MIARAVYGIRVIKRFCCVLVGLFVSIASAHDRGFDITALAGGVFGGTVQLEQLDVPNFAARVQDSLGYGVAGGVRFDSDLDNCIACNLIEFRWFRQNTHLSLKQDQNALLPTPLVVSSFHPAITLDHFLGDFTHEFSTGESSIVKPFITASLGAVRMATPEASATRFVFGIGTGMKIFISPHLGIRFQVEYLPIVMHSELQRVVCTTVSCIAILNGGIMNQFTVSVGPTFRFH